MQIFFEPFRCKIRTGNQKEIVNPSEGEVRAQIEQIVGVAVHGFPAKIRNRSIAAGVTKVLTASFSGNLVVYRCLSY